MSVRWDSAGLWWEDKPVQRGVGARESYRTAPPIPKTGWVPPTEFPRLDAAEVIALDTETKDMGLELNQGPGMWRDDSHIVGISVGTNDGHRWYFPMRHELQPELNLDPNNVLAWARDAFGGTQPKIGANLAYDVGYLLSEGVQVNGPLIDVQIAEPLIDENRYAYDLDSLAKHYLRDSKVDEALYDWCYRAYGGSRGRKQAANIYRAPTVLVGPYAEGDVDLPLRIWEKQKHILKKQQLERLFDVESRLIPLLVAMRRRGVRVDTLKAEKLSEQVGKRIAQLDKQLNGIDIWAADSIAREFDRLGITYPVTKKKKKPSFTKPWLLQHPSDIAQTIVDARKYDKLKGTFIDGHILTFAQNGRIHCSFNQLKSDDYGTVSGRLSSSNPNLQQIPARDPELAPKMRGLFLPEEGEDWWSDDWSQIEPRCLAHYGRGPGADELRAAYRDEPKTDYHDMVGTMIREKTGLVMKRKPTKNIGLGLLYGMGKDRLFHSLGVTKQVGEEMFSAYHAAVPFVDTTTKKAKAAIKARGYLKTLLGRRARFPLWEPSNWNLAQKLGTFRSVDAAKEAILEAKGSGGVRRAHLHKALNRALQGSAADLMKLAMVNVWESGVCDVLGAPLLTVHDELCWSVPRTAEGKQAHAETVRLMTIVGDEVGLRVPLMVDSETGPDWGHLK